MDLWDPQNPAWSAIANLISAFTNIPADRMVNKINNLIEAADDENDFWQRLMLLLGWNTWDVDVETKKDIVKKQIKEQKEKDKEAEKTNEAIDEVNIEVEEEKKEQEKQKEEGKEVEAVTCAYVNSDNERCSVPVNEAGARCRYHETDKDKMTQCTHIKKDKTRCKVSTPNENGRCEYLQPE